MNDSMTAAPDAPAFSELPTSDFQRLVVEELQGLAGGVTMTLGRNEQHRAELAQTHEALAASAQTSAELLEVLARAFEQFVSLRFTQHEWQDEMRYRDLLELFARERPIGPAMNIDVITDHTLAADSVDHRHPWGTRRDNTRAPWFVTRCEELLGRELTVLDLGCAGGGSIFDFTIRGHRAVGLEGSDYSAAHGRAEWRTLRDRLFTCDVARPFEVVETEEGSDGSRMSFDLVTAWDVLEHIEEDGIAMVLENVSKHLRPDGAFIGSVSTRPSMQAPDGSSYHRTIQPREWWERRFAENGFETDSAVGFESRDFPRGNASSPACPESFDAEPGSGFHFVLRRRFAE